MIELSQSVAASAHSSGDFQAFDAPRGAQWSGGDVSLTTVKFPGAMQLARWRKCNAAIIRTPVLLRGEGEERATTQTKANEGRWRPRREGENNAAQLSVETARSLQG
jgi:hypothetical protein